MAEQTSSELLQWLVDNQFLPQPQAEEVRPLVPAMASRHALLKELIGRSWLTPFQANQILANKQEVLILGPYRLLERLGEGAMGQVFKAWNVCLGRFVAVKMLHLTHMANAKAMDRFHQEMATAGHLNHSHIVHVRDAGEADGRPYMVMDFCEGVNLSQVVKSQGPLPIHLACDYIRQAALGLQHASQQGVVHRDIKPSNLMLTKAGPDGPGVVKILDFGLARLQSTPSAGRLTQVGNIIGTIDYIAPEQVENAQKADVRSDIYSLGGSLFYLLVGRPPFTGTTIVEKVSGRLVGEVPQLRQARPDISPELEAVFNKMMALRPAERFQTPLELAQALVPFTRPAQPDLPLAQPVVPMARPVVPLAVPVQSSAPAAAEVSSWNQAAASVSQAAVSELPPEENPFSFAETPVVGASAGTLTSAPAPAAEPSDAPANVLTAFALEAPEEGVTAAAPRPRPAKFTWPTGKKLWILVGSGALGLVLLIWIAVSLFPGGPGTAVSTNDGSLKVLPISPVNLVPGKTKPVIIRVERRGFDGPVKLELKNLPLHISAESGYVKRGETQIDLRVRASFGVEPIQAEATIVATAGNLKAEQPVNINVMLDPFQRK